jgi:hypothetical protein
MRKLQIAVKYKSKINGVDIFVSIWYNYLRRIIDE